MYCIVRKNLLTTALRMAPAHSIGNRRITPRGGAVIAGHRIAGDVGSLVGHVNSKDICFCPVMGGSPR